MKELIEIQNELKAPKGQYNRFGKYSYRSLEDIVEALKPILLKHKCNLFMHDIIEHIGDRYYVKAVVKLINSDGEVIEVSAYAREALSKKGMDESQITGSTSSYARKYALNGLFLIDDTKDADSVDNRTAPAKKAEPINDNELILALQQVTEAKTVVALENVWNHNIAFQSNKAFTTAVKNRKAQLIKPQK